MIRLARVRSILVKTLHQTMITGIPQDKEFHSTGTPPTIIDWQRAETRSILLKVVVPCAAVSPTAIKSTLARNIVYSMGKVEAAKTVKTIRLEEHSRNRNQRNAKLIWIKQTRASSSTITWRVSMTVAFVRLWPSCQRNTKSTRVINETSIKDIKVIVLNNMNQRRVDSNQTLISNNKMNQVSITRVGTSWTSSIRRWEISETWTLKT